MKARMRLTEDRPAYAKSNSGAITTAWAGEVVRVTNTDEATGRMIAEYKGLYTLTINTDQVVCVNWHED